MVFEDVWQGLFTAPHVSESWSSERHLTCHQPSMIPTLKLIEASFADRETESDVSPRLWRR